MALQSSGLISISNIKSQFGSSFNKLSTLYGVAAGVPTSGTIKLSNFYGTIASTPTVPSIGNINTSTTGIYNGSLNLTQYVTDTFGASFIFSAASYSTPVSSASISGNILTYTIPQNTFNTSCTITTIVTNRFGKYATINIPLYITGYNIASSNLPSGTTLTTNTVQFLLSSYFTDYSGTSLTYSLTSNPYGSASITNNQGIWYLSITGSYLGQTYQVTVQASNSYSQVATSSITIVESSRPLPTIDLIGTWYSQAAYWYLVFTSTISGTGQIIGGTLATSGNVTYQGNGQWSLPASLGGGNITNVTGSSFGSTFSWGGYVLTKIANLELGGTWTDTSQVYNLVISSTYLGFGKVVSGTWGAVTGYIALQSTGSWIMPISSNPLIIINPYNFTWLNMNFEKLTNWTGLYTDSFINYTTPTTAQCTNWHNFCLCLVGTTFTRLTITSTYDTIGRSTTSLVNNIAYALSQSSSYAAYDSTTGFTWIVGNCGNGFELTVGTSSTTLCSCSTTSYTIRPCMGSYAWGAVGVGYNTCAGPNTTISVLFSF